MKKELIFLLVCLCFRATLAIAQDRQVTGTVTAEEDGLPVIGASVQVKGTKTGIITDADGNFKLTNVPVSAKTLVISFVGMKTQEVAITGKALKKIGRAHV